jgi:hypothetical protein
MSRSLCCEEPRAGSGKPQGACAKSAKGFARLRQPGQNNGASKRAESGKKNIAAARVNCGNDEPRFLLKNQWSRKGRKRRYPDDWDFACKPDRPRGGYAHTQTSKGPGPNGDRDPVKRSKSALRARDDPVDQRQKRLGVAPLHGHHLNCFRSLGLIVKDAGRNGRKRSVNSQDFHAAALDSSAWFTG